MRAVVLAGRFLLELCLLVALAAGGWALADGGVRGGALAVIAASAAAAAWGAWIAPRSHRRLTDPRRFAVEVALFVLGVASLWVAWTRTAGTCLGWHRLSSRRSPASSGNRRRPSPASRTTRQPREPEHVILGSAVAEVFGEP